MSFANAFTIRKRNEVDEETQTEEHLSEIDFRASSITYSRSPDPRQSLSPNQTWKSPKEAIKHEEAE